MGISSIAGHNRVRNIFLTFLLFTQCSFAHDKNIPINQNKNTYYVDALIEDEKFSMLIDTGSSFVVLTKNPGLKSKRKIIAVLADGRKVRIQVYKIPKMYISNCVVRDVDAVVMTHGINILGMSAIQKISPMTIDTKKQNMIFECGNYKKNPLILKCRGCYSHMNKKS